MESCQILEILNKDQAEYRRLCDQLAALTDGQATLTGSSAITEGPHDALCRLKHCQLLHTCTKKTHFERLAVC